MDTVVFVDGQNLYHLAKEAWLANPADTKSSYAWPSYDVEKLAHALVTRMPGRSLSQIRFYTGVPNQSGNAFWYHFWSNKLRHLRRNGVYTYRGRISSGSQEKGVDVSLAIDLVQATHEQRYDIAIIVSQDSDFGPAVSLSKQIAAAQGRRLTFKSAFPVGSGSSSRRGIPGATWIHIDQATYDACFDHRNYRPRRR